MTYKLFQAPHLGSATIQTRGKMMEMTVQNILNGVTKIWNFHNEYNFIMFPGLQDKPMPAQIK